MNLIAGIDITSGALSASKTRLDIVAQNIANAQTTRTPNGGPYQRQIVSFETELIRRVSGGPALQSVKIGAISNDRSPGQQVFNPQHPDATADGLVTMPNVNLSYEMVDLITASRTYEANLSVVKNARQMAMKAIEIGK
ncbi:MAG: flagellar basal body rod protein FlgC [Verrucomicrobia bacterium]|jgi:flagellar basal-body rod protein FlgC|nr:flagellar basal body rod protein FlgC [Verrucomicrobiota bacterium]